MTTPVFQCMTLRVIVIHLTRAYSHSQMISLHFYEASRDPQPDVRPHVVTFMCLDYFRVFLQSLNGRPLGLCGWSSVIETIVEILHCNIRLFALQLNQNEVQVKSSQSTFGPVIYTGEVMLHWHVSSDQPKTVWQSITRQKTEQPLRL